MEVSAPSQMVAHILVFTAVGYLNSWSPLELVTEWGCLCRPTQRLSWEITSCSEFPSSITNNLPFPFSLSTTAQAASKCFSEKGGCEMYLIGGGSLHWSWLLEIPLDERRKQKNRPEGDLGRRRPELQRLSSLVMKMRGDKSLHTSSQSVCSL